MIRTKYIIRQNCSLRLLSRQSRSVLWTSRSCLDTVTPNISVSSQRFSINVNLGTLKSRSQDSNISVSSRSRHHTFTTLLFVPLLDYLYLFVVWKVGSSDVTIKSKSRLCIIMESKSRFWVTQWNDYFIWRGPALKRSSALTSKGSADGRSLRVFV